MNSNETSACKAVTKRGKLCKARPTQNGFCVLHSAPGLAAELGKRGGRRSRRSFAHVAELHVEPPKTAADIQRMLAEAMVEIRQRRLDPKIGTTLGYLGTALLKAIELHELESRLAAIEEKIDQ
jgi:Family of unknown function (DUF5763)